MRETLKKKVQKLLESGFLKNILTLVSGATIGYAINFFALPLIGRCYTPRDLGEYDIMISIAAVAIDILCLGMITAIMLPREDEKAVAICRIIRGAVIGVATVALGVALMIQGHFKIFHTSRNYTVSLFLLYLYIIVYNLQNIYISYVNRMKRYRVLFWNQIINSSLNVGISLILGILGLGSIGYLLGTVVAMGINVFYMKCQVNPFKIKVKVRELIQTFDEYKSFPMVQMPANFLSTAAKQLPIQFLGRIFGNASLGGYTMACKILSVPVSLIATPVNRVYYRTAAEKVNNNENIGPFVYSIVQTNIKIAIIPIFLLMAFGEYILPFFLGAKWEAAGKYMPILGIYYLVLFCTSSLSGSFILLNRKRMNIIFAVVQLLVTIISFLVIERMEVGLYKALTIYVTVDMFIQLVLMGTIFYLVKFSIKRYLLLVLKYFGGAYIFVLVMELIKNIL